MYSLVRPLLFCMDAETSHNLVLSGLATISSQSTLTALTTKVYANRVPQLNTTVMGIEFPNPVGLGAGLDKQASCANALRALGFGWVELGTVTPLPQAGNPRPRMFRLTSHQAIINRMGFNSIGLDAFIASLCEISPATIKGINIGKNATTPIARAVDDYITCLDAVFPYADYVTINISSPNTSNLRTLQQDEALDNLLAAVHQRRIQLVDQYSRSVPLVLKISPDTDDGEIGTIARLLRKHHIDGIAATNTTISRHSVNDHPHGNEEGGLSGGPLTTLSTRVVKKLYQNLQGEIPIIGIGGIDSVASAVEKFAAGADLIQLYTGLIYQGPKLIRDIVVHLCSYKSQHCRVSFLNALRKEAGSPSR